MKSYYWIAAVAVLSLVLGACGSTAPSDINEPQQAGSAAETLPTTVAEAEVQEPAVVPTTQDSDASAPETEVQEEPTPVEVRQGLAATDPSTVNLANGSPTFVEFFAFW